MIDRILARWRGTQAEAGGIKDLPVVQLGEEIAVEMTDNHFDFEIQNFGKGVIAVGDIPIEGDLLGPEFMQRQIQFSLEADNTWYRDAGELSNMLLFVVDQNDPTKTTYPRGQLDLIAMNEGRWKIDFFFSLPSMAPDNLKPISSESPLSLNFAIEANQHLTPRTMGEIFPLNG